MNLLVIGGGGREHAIVRKLKENPEVETIYCLPGNGGIAADAVCVADIGAKDIPAQVAFAKSHDIDFAVDVYPYYGSDADVALTAGYDVRHGLIGAGVYASHGYERSHKDGVKNTFELLRAYLG